MGNGWNWLKGRVSSGEEGEVWTMEGRRTAREVREEEGARVDEKGEEASFLRFDLSFPPRYFWPSGLFIPASSVVVAVPSSTLQRLSAFIFVLFIPQSRGRRLLPVFVAVRSATSTRRTTESTEGNEEDAQLISGCNEGHSESETHQRGDLEAQRLASGSLVLEGGVVSNDVVHVEGASHTRLLEGGKGQRKGEELRN
jgi:hypothetical protein